MSFINATISLTTKDVKDSQEMYYKILNDTEKDTKYGKSWILTLKDTTGKKWEAWLNSKQLEPVIRFMEEKGMKDYDGLYVKLASEPYINKDGEQKEKLKVVDVKGEKILAY